MKDQISSYDLACINKELQELKDARMDKIYQKEHEFLFQMHVPNKGKKLLRIVIPNYLYLTGQKGDFPQTPAGLCMFLRKKIGSARLRKIEQLEFERILRLEFSTKDANFLLFIEFFPPGNLILCDENLKILSSMISRKWKDRTIRGGIKYDYPKQEYNFLKLTKEQLKSLFKKSKRDSIVKTLAMNLGLGGSYAEEVCARADIDKAKKTADTNTIERLHKAIKELQKLPIKPNNVDGELFPIDLKIHKEKVFLKTFNEVLDKKLTKKALIKKKELSEKKYEKELKKIQNMVKAQEANVKKMQKQYEESQKLAEHIYENYQPIKELLADFNNIRKKHTWQDIKNKLKAHKVVKEINEKKKEIIIEI